jgi:hypothetical protein
MFANGSPKSTLFDTSLFDGAATSPPSKLMLPNEFVPKLGKLKFGTSSELVASLVIDASFEPLRALAAARRFFP